MSEEINMLQAQMRQLMEEKDSEKRDERASAHSGRAEAPAAPEEQRWSDHLGDDHMVVNDASFAAGVPTMADSAVQTDEDGLLESAALRLDAALTKVLSPSLQPSPVEQVRKLKLAAGDVLTVLGFRHAAHDAAEDDTGTTEAKSSAYAVEHHDDAEGQEARTAASASTPRDGDLAQVLGEANRMSAVAATWEKVDEKRRARASERPPLDTDLEAIIAEVQAEEEKSVAASQWPLRLPAFWYNDDPKRAARAIFRNAYGRDSSKHEVDWWTWEVQRPSRTGQAVRPGHVCVARFPVWHTWFKGEVASTVAEAERKAFRAALDHFESWIEWDYYDRRESQRQVDPQS